MLIKLPLDFSGIQMGLDTIEQQLKKYKLDSKKIVKTMLVSEELMVSLMDHADENAQMQLTIRRLLGDVHIEISVPGSAYDFTNSLNYGVSLDEEVGAEAEATLRNIILRTYADDLKYRHQQGRNKVRLSVVRSNRTLLYRTLGAMLLAILLGVILQALGLTSFNNMLHSNLLLPVKTMFMNALKMVVAPVVFFSIVSCISQFSSLSEMGKIGGKVMAVYLLTTFIATGVGIGADYLFQPGDASIAALLTADASSVTGQQIQISMKDTIVGIIPSNFISPFLESDMLQLIFLAVICGIAVGMIGGYSRILTDFFEACNELFLKITTLLVKFMPIAAFCSILSMILTTGTQTLLSVLGICLVFLFALVTMMVIYCLMMPVMSGLNPIPFIKKYAPTMIQVFSMASSNAALPLNMDVCSKKMGVSPKVYSLSLPLGATMNMDGTCIYLGVFALALARIYGLDVSSAGLLSLVISIIVLSIGAPGIPGSGMICLSVLLAQLGVPVEAVGLVIGIDPLIGMLRCMSNCMGDMAACVIVAKKENLMDMDVYQSDAK